LEHNPRSLPLATPCWTLLPNHLIIAVSTVWVKNSRFGPLRSSVSPAPFFSLNQSGSPEKRHLSGPRCPGFFLTRSFSARHFHGLFVFFKVWCPCPEKGIDPKQRPLKRTLFEPFPSLRLPAPGPRGLSEGRSCYNLAFCCPYSLGGPLSLAPFFSGAAALDELLRDNAFHPVNPLPLQTGQLRRRVFLIASSHGHFLNLSPPSHHLPGGNFSLA